MARSGLGTADFFSVVKAFFYPGSWDTLGGPTNNENDGSAAAFWTTQKGMGSAPVQNTNPTYVGLQTPSRYLFVPSQAGRLMQLRVDGKLLPAGSPISWPSNNNMAKIDFGSTAAGAGRKIVMQGVPFPGLWLSEVAVAAGAAITPYDWHADTGRISAAYLGDSYGIINPDYSLVGLPFVQYIAELCGFGAMTQSSIGGTGYITTGGSSQYPNAQDSIRLDVISREQPTAILGPLGVNDPGDAATIAGMQALYATLRTRNPQALLIAMPPWSPGQTAAANPGGKYQAMRTALYNTMAGVSGPWIIIDNLAGSWLTSKGTSSGAATGPWLTGDGNAGAPTGSGNADTWMSADVPHLTAAGAKGYAELLAAAYRAAVLSM